MKKLIRVFLAASGLILSAPSFAAEKFGIFETILESSTSYSDTAAALEAAIANSSFALHGVHNIRVPDDIQQARIYVLTSASYQQAAANESPRTVSAQVLRVAVFTRGEELKTYVNMANPVAHAMVYYSRSDNRDALIAASQDVAAEIRQLVAEIPGEAVSIQAEPMRTEKHLGKYKGDGPARMMAKFRNWQKSQRRIISDSAENFDAVVAQVEAALSVAATDEDGANGWDKIATIALGDDAVYVGVSNPYIENKMVRINSRFRKDNKADSAPYPGVDHVTALPTDILIVREDDQTVVLHYGQMWRMQLYFWDSGYRAFTANVGVPGKIAKSIKDAVTDAGE